MRVLFQFKLVRPSVLDGVAQPMQRADARVPTPRKDELGDATHPDQLVVDKVGRHSDQRQILAALADDLVAGSVRNEMREAFQSDGVAIMDGGFDGFRERGNSRHTE